MGDPYNVLIVGSGSTGSSVALARVGIKGCAIERGPHPRSVTGESTAPELGSDRSRAEAIEDPPYAFRWLGGFASENAATREDRGIFQRMHRGFRLVSRFVFQRLRDKRGGDPADNKAFTYIQALRIPRALVLDGAKLADLPAGALASRPSQAPAEA